MDCSNRLFRRCPLTNWAPRGDVFQKRVSRSRALFGGRTVVHRMFILLLGETEILIKGAPFPRRRLRAGAAVETPTYSPRLSSATKQVHNRIDDGLEYLRFHRRHLSCDEITTRSEELAWANIAHNVQGT